MQADADRALEIVFVQSRLTSIRVRIVNVDGTVVSDWSSPEGTSLSSVPALGTDVLWGLNATAFVAFDAQGRRVDEYRADSVHYLRRVAGTRAGEYVALVASGNGMGRGDRAVLHIYDRNRRLVHQEVFTAQAWAITSDPAASAILVAVGERLYRYSLAIASMPGR
jgi:hypothetical protein